MSYVAFYGQEWQKTLASICIFPFHFLMILCIHDDAGKLLITVFDPFSQ